MTEENPYKMMVDGVNFYNGQLVEELETQKREYVGKLAKLNAEKRKLEIYIRETEQFIEALLLKRKERQARWEEDQAERQAPAGLEGNVSLDHCDPRCGHKKLIE